MPCAAVLDGRIVKSISRVTVWRLLDQAAIKPHRPAEVFADFVESVCGEHAGARTIHFVLDNLNTHRHALTCRVVAKFSRCPVPPIKTGFQRKTFLA